MRFLRAVRASILRARFSLSAVSSSTELEAVLASMPSFLRRSMTSWLESPRSRASWKILTFPIRLPSIALGLRHGGGLGLRLDRLAARGLGVRGLRCSGLGLCGLRSSGLGGVGRRLLLGEAARLFLGGLLRGEALGLQAGRLLGVALVPLLLGDRGRLA